MKLRFLLLATLCVIAGQARAGLFNDDVARQQIDVLSKRVSTQEDAARQQAENEKQQTSTLLDLQSQIQALNAELRTLRGQNEELLHTQQDLDKRQKDFYIDLDTRVRRLETIPEAVAAPSADLAKATDAKATDAQPGAVDDPAVVNRAYESAHALYKNGKHQDAVVAYLEFLKKFPDAVYVPSVHYELGAVYFLLNDYKRSQEHYQELLDKYAYSPKVPEAMLGVADCKRELKEVVAAKKILTQLVAKYPQSSAAAEAKKRLAKSK